MLFRDDMRASAIAVAPRLVTRNAINAADHDAPAKMAVSATAHAKTLLAMMISAAKPKPL